MNGITKCNATYTVSWSDVAVSVQTPAQHFPALKRLFYQKTVLRYG